MIALGQALLRDERPVLEIVLNVKYQAIRERQLVRFQQQHGQISRDLFNTLLDPCTWFHVTSAHSEREAENDQTKRHRAKRRKELSELRSIDRTARNA